MQLIQNLGQGKKEKLQPPPKLFGKNNCPFILHEKV